MCKFIFSHLWGLELVKCPRCKPQVGHQWLTVESWDDHPSEGTGRGKEIWSQGSPTGELEAGAKETA